MQVAQLGLPVAVLAAQANPHSNFPGNCIKQSKSFRGKSTPRLFFPFLHPIIKPNLLNCFVGNFFTDVLVISLTMINVLDGVMAHMIKNRVLVSILILLVILGSGPVLTGVEVTAVLAQTVVDLLPENNLVENPWFRNGNRPSLEGWTDAAGENAIWSLSQKQSNPSPDEVVGTSARLAFGSGQGGGTGQGGVDSYLYQVIEADPSLTHLQFKIHWVTQWIDQAAVTIYGGNSVNGPWTAVWVPLDVDQSTSSGGAWTQTELLDTTIAEGFPFYKIELFGRYPDGRQQGAKYTGVYFNVDGEAGAVVEPPPAPTEEPAQPEPTTPPPAETAVSPTNTPAATAVPEEAQPTAEPETIAAVASTPEPEPTQPAPRPTRVRETAVPDNNITPTNNTNTPSPIYLAIIVILLLLVIVLGIGWARAARS